MADKFASSCCAFSLASNDPYQVAAALNKSTVQTDLPSFARQKPGYRVVGGGCITRSETECTTTHLERRLRVGDYGWFAVVRPFPSADRLWYVFLWWFDRPTILGIECDSRIDCESRDVPWGFGYTPATKDPPTPASAFRTFTCLYQLTSLLVMCLLPLETGAAKLNERNCPCQLQPSQENGKLRFTFWYNRAFKRYWMGCRRILNFYRLSWGKDETELIAIWYLIFTKFYSRENWVIILWITLEGYLICIQFLNVMLWKILISCKVGK